MDDPKMFDPKLFDHNTKITDMFLNKRERKESARRGKVLTNSKTPSTTGKTTSTPLCISIKDLHGETPVLPTCSTIRIRICQQPISMKRFSLSKRLLALPSAKALVSRWQKST